ncbi:MAG: EAL domain-containing protein [Lachnospiraceae bacterium]|nr:EAL domain-containing protein [Lachnospiraceae bacterium]
MPVYSERQVLDNDLMEEWVKQIALNHFYAFYVRQDLEGVLRHVKNDVRWMGHKDYLIAHNKEEYENLLKKEINHIPVDCVLKVIRIESAAFSPGYYDVNGELELRIPHRASVLYRELRFSMVILNEDGNYAIASLHTSMSGEGFLSYGVMNESGKPIRHMVEDMKNQDQYDILTGLYTLDSFKREAKRMLEKSAEKEKFAVFCTDIGQFEKINNLYGLRHADQVLIELANLLTSCSKTVKICCRSVADHFLVLITYNEVKALKSLLKKICGEYDRTIGKQYAEADPSLGIGVYLVEDKNDDIEKIVECANMARKDLGHPGRSNLAFYDAKTYVRMEKVKRIERIMKGALESKEFKTYLQPKYDLDTGVIVGAEALTRWIRHDGTAIYPDEFIPIFERNGFIGELDFYMLRSVCEMIQRRLKEGKKCVPVSINQSRVLLGDTDYVSKIAAVLAKYNTPPEYIELELTERLFKDNLSDMAKMMGKLKELGIRWSIDDFGTGYSSLNLLKELPVDIIKLDKTFLDESETSNVSKIIIQKTVELTRELDKMVVCEGVETESQAEYLRDIHCDMAQGYLYARPMPMEEFEQILDKETIK